MRNFKNFAATIVMLLCCFVANAQTFEVDGLKYTVTSTDFTVEVRKGSTEPIGELVIPAVVGYEGQEYRVSSIGSSAFHTCTKLTSIILPESIALIDGSAFAHCSELTSIVFSQGLITIGSYAFYGCSKLTSIVLPQGLTTIGSSAFIGCSELTSIVFSQGLITIGSAAFNGCSKLTSIVFPQGLTTIGSNAFSSCVNLTSIVLPQGLTTIGSRAFSSCSELKSITLPESLVSIESDAFNQCSKIADINIESIDSWLKINCEDEASHPNYTASNWGVNVNLYVKGVLLTEIEVPSSVTSIPDYAFYGFGKLTSINLSSNVRSIGKQAFGRGVEIVRIDAITPPELSSSYNFIADYSVIVIPESAYESYCTAPYWKDDALCQKIATKEAYKQVLTLNAKDDYSVLYEAIGEINLSRVVDLTINGSINSHDFFMMRTKMTALRYLDLTNASIVYNLREHYSGYHTENNIFPAYGLSNCKLRSVKLPKDITEIGIGSFKNNPVKEIEIPGGVTSIGGGAFSYCSTLISVVLPYGVEVIGSNTFAYCPNLERVVLPPTVKQLGESVFSDCSNLREIRIPSSVREIGNYAFYACSNLSDIYVYTIEPISITSYSFPVSGNNFVGTLHAPKVSYANYYGHTQWGQFLKFEAFDEPYEDFYLNGDKELNNSTGAINGTEGNNPDAEMGNNSGLIVGGDVNQNLGDVDVEHDGENGGSIIVDGNGCVNADKLHFHINVKGGKWYFFCFPFDVRKEDIKLENGADWVFRYYDGGERANNGKGGWKNVTSDGDGNHLKAATGYIFQCSNDDVLILTAKNQKLKQEKKYNELVEHVTANMHDASWNFVGNPYLSYYEVTSNDYSAPITVWDGSKYIAIRPGDDDYQLAPFQAFFVQKPTGVDEIEYSPGQQMTYNQAQKAATQARARRREVPINPDRLLVNITLSNGTDTDQTRVVFNNDVAMGYETACDASKFETAGIPQLYTIDSRAVKYAINERPIAEGIVTLGYSVPTQGNYTLAAPRMDTPVAVKDNLTGTIHNFAEGSYTFMSEAGTFEGRFTVIMKAGETSIDNAEIRNQESEIYNVKGQRVENADEQGIYIKNNRKVVSL